MNDEFDNIFEGLSPDDFLQPVKTDGVPVPHDPDLSLDDFVRLHLGAVRRAFKATKGRVEMVAHLVVGDTKYAFGPKPFGEETVDQFLDRVHTEAQMLGATMLFVNRRTKGGLLATPADDLRSPTDPEQYKKILDAGLSREVMFYFAQRNHGSVHEYRHGVMYVEGDRLGAPEEAYGPVESIPFAHILRRS